MLLYLLPLLSRRSALGVVRKDAVVEALHALDHRVHLVLRRQERRAQVCIASG